MGEFSSVWITGASSGIGEALALSYAGPEATLGLLATNAERLGAVAARCRERGARVFTYAVDVSDAAKSRAAARDFLGKAGAVDLVLANAGIRLEEDPDLEDPSIQERTMAVNFMGVVNTVAPFLPSLKRAGRGRIAVVSSISSFRATPNSGAYSASKAAVNLWTEALRLRLKPFGISVSTLCCGFVDTPMTRGLPFWMPGLISADRAAALIQGFVLRRRRRVTFPWPSMLIWTFFRLLPGFLYDRLILALKNRHPVPLKG